MFRNETFLDCTKTRISGYYLTNLAERTVQVKDNTIAPKTQIAAKPLDASGEAASKLYMYKQCATVKFLVGRQQPGESALQQVPARVGSTPRVVQPLVLGHLLVTPPQQQHPQVQVKALLGVSNHSQG